MSQEDNSGWAVNNTSNTTSNLLLVWCHVCGNKTNHVAGYLGTTCKECGVSWSRPDGEIRIPIMHVKQANKLSWNKLADRCGWKGSTARKYYHCEPYRLWERMLAVGLLHEEDKE